MGVGAGLYMYDVVLKRSRSLSHLLMSSCLILVSSLLFFGRPFVKPFALCYRNVVLSVLSVTLVYSGQTVGRIKMKLGMQVGHGPGHILLDGNPAPPPQKGTPGYQIVVCAVCLSCPVCLSVCDVGVLWPKRLDGSR